MWIHQANTSDCNKDADRLLCAYGEYSPHRQKPVGSNTRFHYWEGCEACGRTATLRVCPFCAVSLRQFDLETLGNPREGLRTRIAAVCPSCAWWTVIDRAVIDNTYFTRTSISAAVAVLVEFDVSSLATPLQVCRDELSSRPMSRLDLHPRRLEEVVASIFSDVGYETELTAYSGDGGVDMFLRGPDDALSAVQVKRYKGSIGAEQIRSFVGALFLRGVLKGAYVTTSEFTKGAVAEANASASKGRPIELIDCKRLFEYLRLAQVKRRSSFQLSDVGLEPGRIKTHPVWMEAVKG